MTEIEKPAESSSTTSEDPIATAIIEQLGESKSLTFKDIAMAIAETRRRPKDDANLWKRYINAVKQQSIHLARQGRVEIIRKGEVVDPGDFKGIVRLRLKQD